jgi:hypothetical protein
MKEAYAFALARFLTGVSNRTARSETARLQRLARHRPAIRGFSARDAVALPDHIGQQINFVKLKIHRGVRQLLRTPIVSPSLE